MTEGAARQEDQEPSMQRDGLAGGEEDPSERPEDLRKRQKLISNRGEKEEEETQSIPWG